MFKIKFIAVIIATVMLMTCASATVAEDAKAQAVECIRNAEELEVYPDEGIILVEDDDGSMHAINMADNSVRDYYDVEVLKNNNRLVVKFDENSGKYLTDYNGNIILEPIYDSFSGTSAENCIIVRKNDKEGLIDANGNELIAPTFDIIWGFESGYAHVETDDMHGFIDTAGNYLVEPVYYDAYGFSEGLAGVQDGSLYGFINTAGEIVIEPAFFQGGMFNNRLCRVIVNNEGYGVINAAGEIIVEPDGYDALGTEYTENGLIWFMKNDKYGYLDTNGNLIAEAQFDEGDKETVNGFAMVEKDGKFGLVGSNGVIIEPVYNFVSDFSEGLVLVKEANDYGYVDANGNMVIDMQYKQAKDFSGGYAAVSIDGKYGYIDTAGNVAIEATYEDAQSFHNGYAAVKLGGKWGVIDTAGTLIVSAVYDYIYNNIPDLMRRSHSANNNDLFMLITGDALGFFNTTNNVLVEPAYICKSLYHVDGKYVVAYNDGLTYILDAEGNIIY